MIITHQGLLMLSIAVPQTSFHSLFSESQLSLVFIHMECNFVWSVLFPAVKN